MYPLFLEGASDLRECVPLVLPPSPGKVPAVVWIAPAPHADFVPVIQVRNSAHRKNQAKRQLQPPKRSLRRSRKAGRIWIPAKRHHKIGGRGKRILTQDVR